MVTRVGLAAVTVLAASLFLATPAAIRAQAAPVVIATVYPLYEFTRQVAADHARVVPLTPPGIEPHHWEPTPRDIAQLQQAQVLVYNGAGLEPWLERLLPDLRRRKVVIVNATEGLPLLAAERRVNAKDDGRDHRHAKKHDPAALHDPHVWLDPVLAQAQVDRIRTGLSKAHPGNAGVYAATSAALKEELAALDRAYEEGLASCRRRDIVVAHAAFGYLARRYKLTQVPVLGLAREAEPSPGELAAIVRLARERNVRYIFFETLASSRLAETLAREVGARTLVLNPLEGLTAEEAAAGETYFSLMRRNLDHLRTALECA